MATIAALSVVKENFGICTFQPKRFAWSRKASRRPGIGRYATGNGHLLNVQIFRRPAQFVHQDVDNGCLQGRTKILLVLFDEIRVLLQLIAQGIKERGFQSAETIVVTGDMRLAECKSLRIPFVGKAVHDRTAGITQAHHLRTFVERFTGSVVDRLPDHFHIVVSIHLDDLRVSTRNQEAKERERRGMIVFRRLLDKMSQHVRLQCG